MNIVRHKTCYYTFHLPLALGLVVTGDLGTRVTEDEVREVAFAIGEYFQIQVSVPQLHLLAARDPTCITRDTNSQFSPCGPTRLRRSDRRALLVWDSKHLPIPGGGGGRGGDMGKHHCTPPPPRPKSN